MNDWGALSQAKRIFPSVAFVLAVALAPAATFAASYLPGQTLDPSCLPTDPTCIVVSPSATNIAAVFQATSTTATSTFAGGVSISGTASSTNAVISNGLTIGSATGILKTIAGLVQTALVNLSSDVTGILGISNGGTGTATAPTYGQILVGNGSGGYTLTATTSLGVVANAAWGTITGTIADQTDLQSILNTKLSSSSLAASAALAGLVSDHTGSGLLVFSSSPTFSGTPVYAGGGINYSVASTSTIPNNTPSAWSIATSTNGLPLFSIDTTNGSEQVSFGLPGASVIVGNAGQASNLVFQENSFIEGAGSGRTITLGANGDIVNFGVNTGFGTTTPQSLLTVGGGASIGADYDLAAPTNGLIVEGNVGIQNPSPIYPLDVTGYINTDSASGYKIGGANALYASSSASYLVAVGPGAGGSIMVSATSSSITSGIYDTAIGYQALTVATSTNQSTAVGYQALKNSSLQANSGNDAFGYQALVNATYALNNAAFGRSDLSQVTTGNNNVAVGIRAQETLTTGNDNVGIGFRALGNNVTGGTNIGIGSDASRYNRSATNTIAIGFQSAGGVAATNFSGAQGYTILGYQAGGRIAANSNWNTLLGYEAGNLLTTGADNIIIGAASTTVNDNLTTGSQNVKIGNNISFPSATASGQLNIQNIIFGTGNTAIGSNVSMGNIGIGTTTPGSLFSLNNIANFAVATSTFYSTGGINLGSGCFAVGGVCISGGGTSYTFSYPLTNTANTISLAFGTTTSNTWSNLQTFSSGINFAPASGNAFAKFNSNAFITASTTGNLSIGILAGANESDYASSTAFGYEALLNATSSVSNAAFGYQALEHALDLSGGLGVGGASSGSANTAVGYTALVALTSGVSNSALGYSSLRSLTTGNNNVTVGARSQENLVTGNDNVGIGFRTLGNNVTGGSNIGIGSDASRYNLSATSTVAIGFQTAGGVAATNFSGAQGYTILGYQAGGRIAAASNWNTLLGYEAGNLLTTGADNIVIGAASTTANDNLTTGSQNVKIGNNISFPNATASGQLNIQNIIFGTGNTAIGSNVSSGNVGIGTTTPWGRLSVTGTDVATATAALAVGDINNAPLLNVYDNGYVGIGTSSPGSLFSIQGIANWTNATSTIYSTGGINLSGGCFAVNGTCLAAGGGGGSGTVNSGTTGQLAYYASGGTAVSGTSTVSISSTGALNLNLFGSNIFNFGPSNSKFLTASTTGNLALGILAGGNESDYASSTAIGYQALRTATSSVANVAVGFQALGNLIDLTGGQGTASSNSGSANSAIGYAALAALTSGVDNSALGYASLKSLTTANNNVTVGARSQENLVTGNDNIGVGFRALGNNVTGGSNIGIGSDASRYNLSATSTIAIGFQTAGGITASNFNGVTGYSIIGYQAGGRITTGANYNTLLGYEAGNLLTTGADNIIIGAAPTTANDNLTTGSQNIKIGDNISFASTTASGQLNIQNIIFGTGNTAIGSSVSTGNIGIGTTTPYSRLSVWGPDSASSTLAFNVVNNSSTTVFALFDGGNAQLSGTLTQSSDARLKTNIQSLDASTSLEAINSLSPVAYDWLDPEKGGVRQYGFIAQQVKLVFPNLVATTSATALTPDGTLGLNYIGLIAPVIKAIQALSSELASVENSISGFADKFTTKELTFTRATGVEIDVQKLCIGLTCVTEDQLKSLLAGVGPTTAASDVGSGASTATATSSAPVIAINGENPALIHVGETYADLGAIITGPQADLNLGIDAIVDADATTSLDSIQINTSTPGTHTIVYSVTDQNGLTSTATRTVNVVSAGGDQTEVPTSTPDVGDTSTTTSSATSSTQ